MLPLLVCLLVAAGPALSAAFPAHAPVLLLQAATAGFFLWLAGRVGAGYIPLPSGRSLGWAAVLLLLGTLSARVSPLWVQAAASWRPILAGVWIILAMAGVSKGQRGWIDEFLRASGWVLMAVVFYQRFSEGTPRPTGLFPSTETLAASTLLLIPLAVQREDWILTGGLALALCWSGGPGAWLGLAAALAVVRAAGMAGYWSGLGIGLVCLVAIYGKFQSPEVLDRWRWWAAAWEMAWAKPWLGWGPGSFGAASIAFLPEGPPAAADPHQLPLKIAAEFGWPFAALWGTGVLHCLRVGGPHKSFGAIAVLVQSLWEPGLAAPANWWLFSYYAGSALSESAHGWNVASRYKLPGCVLAAGLGWALVQAAGSSPAVSAAQSRRAAAELTAPSGAPLSPERMLAAAAHLEEAAELDPFDAATLAELERLYGRLGLAELAQAKAAEGAAVRRRP